MYNIFFVLLSLDGFQWICQPIYENSNRDNIWHSKWNWRQSYICYYAKPKRYEAILWKILPNSACSAYFYVVKSRPRYLLQPSLTLCYFYSVMFLDKQLETGQLHTRWQIHSKTVFIKKHIDFTVTTYILQARSMNYWQM